MSTMHNKSESPITVEQPMIYDDILWERSDEIFAGWRKKLFNQDVFREIGSTIIEHRGGPPEELLPPRKGSFNVILPMKFLDGGSAVIRFPAPGYSGFPEEKVHREVSVMRFIEQSTGIRVPHVLHYGMDGPAGLGPFIVMEYIENDSDLDDALNVPGHAVEDLSVLDPNIAEDRLRTAYSGMADILLQLSRHSFPEIGCIANNEDDEFDDNWLGGVPKHLLPQGPFTTASSYFLALAESHMTHLASQRNDAVTSKEDCEKKYIARCLFRKLARENRLSRRETDAGPFLLFGDDLRPANVLANSEYNYSAVGAIDWEFTYSAPSEFAYSPPWWLLLMKPEDWSHGIDNWIVAYEKRLPVFLDELRKREDIAIQRGIPSLFDGTRLLNRMQESWDSGDFWVCYAARKSWAFDMVYWTKIDRRFFGPGSLEDRMEMLSPEERLGMDAFVQRKVVEMEKRE